MPSRLLTPVVAGLEAHLFKRVSVFFSLALVLSGQQGPAVFAIRDAKVFPASGPSIERGTVVLRNGLIEAAGANVQIPPDAWVIDGKGLTIYPGFIDALSSWGIPATTTVTLTAASTRASASATPSPSSAPTATVAPPPPIRGPEDRPSNSSYVRAADQIVATDPGIQAARDCGFTAAVTYPAPKIFSGQGALFNLAGDRVGNMVIASPAGLHVTMALPPATVVFTARTFPGSLMGVMAYVHQIYLDAEHYKAARETYAQHPQGLVRPAYDHTLEGVLESPRVLLPARRAVEIDRMIRFAGELKVKAVLYGGDEAWRSADQLKAAQIPVLVSLKWPARSPDADPSRPESMRVLEMREKAPSTPAALAKAGVTFAFYSDGVAPRDLMRAAKRAVDAGLAPEDAVRAFSLNAAKIYGVDDRLGSIEKGKIANLVVTDGDIFEQRSRIKYIFVDGHMYEPGPSGSTLPASTAVTGGQR